VILDKVDCELLNLLQEQGRTKRNELAEKVGLSLPAVSERMRKLEEEGIILGYYAKLNHKYLGKDITAIVIVTIDSSKHFPNFLDHIAKMDEIQECHAITGEGTHLLKVRTENTEGLERLLAKIQSWPGVLKTSTNLVLSSPKETTFFRIHPHKP
jgi:Lrp/AsnC family transcriptional regulator, leucine-responsive regulatory protein